MARRNNPLRKQRERDPYFPTWVPTGRPGDRIHTGYIFHIELRVAGFAHPIRATKPAPEALVRHPENVYTSLHIMDPDAHTRAGREKESTSECVSVEFGYTETIPGTRHNVGMFRYSSEVITATALVGEIIRILEVTHWSPQVHVADHARLRSLS